MRSFKVRLSDNTFEQIAQAAHDEGVSAAQYMREAAIARVWFEHGTRQNQLTALSRTALALARLAGEEGVTLEELIERLYRRRDP